MPLPRSLEPLILKRNPNFPKLKAGYLFPEIHRRKMAFLARCPDAKLINLGIGDTTQPLKPHVVKGLVEAALDLGSPEHYTGYGPEQGILPLREKIAKKLYGGRVHPHEVFISDGAKCDIGRLQMMFGQGATLAVQDPTYPVYVDTAVINGQTGHGYDGIVYMPCIPENDFFPDLGQLERTDLIYFCSPNNPTGAAATREQLQRLVDFAKKNRSILIYDSAYAIYIRDEALPKSIYEIEGAKEVAIEVSSFSKIAGFTGVRLGWSVVPDELKFDDGTPVRNDWSRMQSTFFNGASNIAQKGGLFVLDEEGFAEVNETISYYLENTRLLKEALEGLGYETHGGKYAPYLWVKFPHDDSWEVFERLLEEKQIVTTPGSGFGSAGEGFIRFSGLGRRSEIEEAIFRLTDFSW